MQSPEWNYDVDAAPVSTSLTKPIWLLVSVVDNGKHVVLKMYLRDRGKGDLYWSGLTSKQKPYAWMLYPSPARMPA